MSDSKDKTREHLEKFLIRSVQIIKDLSAEKMIEESAINPLLAKTLGFNDFDSLARFYVYQRVGRSLVTSFGTRMEEFIKAIIGGEKGTWWDVVKKTPKVDYYISVKSGPRDMNKDQVIEFSRRAKQIMKTNPKAHPLIAMVYGKKIWPVITDTLRKEGLDPDKHSAAGKKLYDLLVGNPHHYKVLLNLVTKIESQVIGNQTILDILEDKVKEIASDFKKKYKDVDDLLADTF